MGQNTLIVTSIVREMVIIATWVNMKEPNMKRKRAVEKLHISNHHGKTQEMETNWEMLILGALINIKEIQRKGIQNVTYVERYIYIYIYDLGRHERGKHWGKRIKCDKCS